LFGDEINYQLQATWCVAKFSASEVELNENIEYACNMLGDCKIIQAGGSCFYPNTTLNHASVVMNQYYAKNGRNDWDCYFRGSALIVVNDPSKLLTLLLLCDLITI
jgi:hypothetical protein